MPGFSPGTGRPRPTYKPRKLACPNCGDQLEIKNETSRLAVCPSCRSHIEVTAADAKVLQHRTGAVGLAGIFQLQIGAHFRYRKVRYEVIGRLRLDELEEPQPTCNYLLFNPRHGTLWLSEYAGHWDISHTSRVMPGQDPRGLKKGDRLVSYDGRKWLLGGKGTYRVTYVDGALPWVAKINDEIDYAELVAQDGSGETYEVEYPQTGGSEMEAGRGHLLTVEEVRQATGQDVLKPSEGRENVREITKVYGTMKKAAFFFVLFNLVCLIGSGCFGNKVLEQYFSPEELGGEVLSEPFTVAAAGNVVKLDMSSKLSNAWMTIDLGLVRDDDVDPTVVHVTDSDMSYYHGREGGESWSEGSKSASRYFVVDEPGTYRLLVRAVSGRGNQQSSTTNSEPLRIKVYDGVKRGFWFVLGMFASGIALIIVFAQHQKWRTADDEDE